MKQARMLVALLPETRLFYKDKAGESDVLLRTLQSNAVEYFMNNRQEQQRKKQQVRYLVAPKAAELVNVFLPEKVRDKAALAAESDGVSLRQFVHTALVLGADNLQALRK